MVAQQQMITNRRGSILLLVLIVIVVLTVSIGAYLQLMQNEHFAVRQHGRMQFARSVAESGVTYLQLYLSQTPSQIQLQGGLRNNPSMLQGVLVEDNTIASERSRFSILSPAMFDSGSYSGVNFGVEDESSKIHVNSLTADEQSAAERLMALPGMTEILADAILDWLDSDDEPRPNGAEQQYYQSLTPQYEPRNGPIAELDELLLVRGVTPEMLYGLDRNRNLRVDSDELPRGSLAQLDTSSGSLNRGWSAYLTVYSSEGFLTPEGEQPIDLNGQDLQKLHDDLVKEFDAEKAKFIIAYRQYGGPRPSDAEGSEGDEETSRNEAAANDERENSGQRGGQEGEQEVSANELEIDFQRQGQAQINSLLDLVGAEVRVTPDNENEEGEQGEASAGNGRSGSGSDGENGNDSDRSSGRGGERESGGSRGGNNGQGESEPVKLVKSPWTEDLNSYRELLDLYDYCIPGNQGPVAGRISVSTGSRVALLSVPGMEAPIVDQILALREPLVDPILSEQRHALWLLTQGVVDFAQFRQLEPYITASGDVFSCQVAGFYDATPTVARIGVVLDRSSGAAQLVDWRDLSDFGPGFSPTQLGAPTSNRLR